MRALQLHYVAVPGGGSTTGEFQLRAASRGVGQQDRRHVGEWCRVAIPRPAIPVVFQYRTLGSERGVIVLTYAVAQAVAAHALIVDRNALDTWPVDYIDWPGWRQRLPLGADADRKPVRLPGVELAGVPSAQQVSLRALSRFLQARSGRDRWLSTLLALLCLAPKRYRPIVIRDAAENGLLWIACLQKSLPLPHAREVSVSSCQFGEQGAASINVTTSGTGFTFDGAQRDQRFFMFDLSGGKLNSVLPGADETPSWARAYAGRITFWMREDQERLAGFHHFAAAHFNHHRLDAGLWWALRVYEQQVDSDQLFRPDEVRPIAAFIEHYLRPGVWGEMAATLASALPKLAKQAGFEDCRPLLRLLETAAHATGAAKERRQIFLAWRQLFDILIIDRRLDPEPILQSFRDLEKSFSKNRDELYGVFLEPAHLRWLRASLHQVRLDIVESVPWLVLDTGLKAGWPDRDLMAELGIFIATLIGFGQRVEPSFHKLLKRAAGHDELVAGLLLLGWRSAERAPAKRQRETRVMIVAELVELMDECSVREATTIRRWLNDEGALDLLLEEWRIGLARTSQPRGLYKQYRKTVLAELDEYRERYFTTVCATLFEALNDKDRQRQALDWIRSEDWDWLPEGLCRACLRLVNARLSMDVDDGREDALADLVDEYARRSHLVLEPNKPLLRACIRYVQADEVVLHDDWFVDVERALSDVGRRDYKRFLDQVMPVIMKRAVRRRDHRKIIDALPDALHLDLFLERYYVRYLAEFARRSQTMPPIPEVLVAALHFWVAPAGRAEADPALRGIKRRMWDRLVTILVRWDEQPLQELILLVDRLVRQEPLPVRESWRRFLQELASARHSVLDYLQTMFRKGWIRVVGFAGR